MNIRNGIASDPTALRPPKVAALARLREEGARRAEHEAIGEAMATAVEAEIRRRRSDGGPH